MPLTPPTAGRDHGGRLDAARLEFPDAPEPFLDLSTGINPVAYPVGAIPAEAWTRLPEPHTITALESAAANAFGVQDPSLVVAGPGTQSFISMVPALFPFRDVAVRAPTYNEHAAAWRDCGASVAEVGDLAELGAARCVVLCNPNNPDGLRMPPSQLLALADALAAKSGLLIVDEAFCDFEQDLTLAPKLPHPALLILRSFGKAYGLAGLRLGFALAAPDLATRLRRALGPWPVSGPAATIGTRALLDHAWLGQTAARLTQDAVNLDGVLTAAGLTVVGGTLLFRLAETDDAFGVYQRLGQAGILVRRFPAQSRWLRFGVPADQLVLDRLANALRTRS